MSSLKALPGIQQFQMEGDVAIITGGSKGLGAAMAAGLASAGAKVAIVSRNLDEATTVAEEVAVGFGTETAAFAADVTNED